MLDLEDTDVFSLKGFIDAASKGCLMDYWMYHELPTTSCPQVTGLAVNAVFVCHKQIQTDRLVNYSDCWLLALTCMKQQKVAYVNIINPVPGEYYAQFYHPGKSIYFNVPLSSIEALWTDFHLLDYILKG